MSESFVTGIIALITIMTPVVILIKALQKLTDSCKALNQTMQETKKQNEEDVKEIWEHATTQDKQLKDHEFRLHDLDGKWFNE